MDSTYLWIGWGVCWAAIACAVVFLARDGSTNAWRLPAGHTEDDLLHGYASAMTPADIVALALISACSILCAFGLGPWGCA